MYRSRRLLRRVNMLTLIREYSPLLPLKFLITSRPDQEIRHIFNHEADSKFRVILHWQEIGIELFFFFLGLG